MRAARFIPTCVGNTNSAVRCCWISSVHPHVRGEYFVRVYYDRWYSGSSPRAWGIQSPCWTRHPPLRFIPTCVGNTVWPNTTARKPAVHPHVRGEYSTASLNPFHRVGSSPRAWGIPTGFIDHDFSRRFIPTCVGNTPASPILTGIVTVHPHVRGEYSSIKHEEFSKVSIAAKIYRSGTA